MRVGESSDSDRHRSTRKTKEKPTTGTSSSRSSGSSGTTTARPVRDPDATRDRSSTSSSRGNATTLDRDASSTPRNPSAGRDVAARQSSTAAALTGEHGGPSTFDRLSAEEEAGDSPGVRRLLNEDEQATVSPEELERRERLDHLVDNPVEEEQRTDVETPPPFQAGSPAPEIPNFQDQRPTRSEPSPLGGTVDTFERDGVTYTRTTERDGTVRTTYEQNGVDYSNTRYEDGRSSTLISDDRESGLHTRTIDTAANGQVTDTSRSSQGTLDGDGNWSYQSREETVGPDGVRTINEEVNRPDGGTATVTRTVQPDGRVNEVYNYEGDQGTVNRTTNTAVDGSSEIRTERSYTVPTSLETTLSENGVTAPEIPEAIEHQVPPLPEGERQDTRVREVEVVTTDPAGAETLQYSEQSYSQTSGDVRLEGSRELGHGRPGDTFHQPILPNEEDSSVTRTVTRVQTRDENGQLVSSTGASQTVTLVGDRPAELEQSGQVSVTRTDSWNQTGESSSTFATDGFREDELFGLNDGGEDISGFRAWVGSYAVSAGYPNAGVGPFDAYNRKGDLEEWMDLDGSDSLDVGVTVNRNADGDVTNRSLTLDATDEHGNGRTATRSDSGGAVGWTYNDYSNNGQDYRRQTVFEGTDISIYESHETTGPGQFRTSSETREDGEVVATSDASRVELSEAQLRESVSAGELTQAQLDRMLTDGPPYYAERYTEHADALRDDDGNLREDENGDPIQPGHDVRSYNISNSDGYAVAQQFRSDPREDGGSTSSTLDTVTDPASANPITGAVVNRETTASGSTRVTDQGNLSVSANGTLTYNGQEVGQFETGGSELSTLLRDGHGINALSLLGKVNQGTSDVVGELDTTRFRPRTAAALGVLDNASEVLGVALGAHGIFSGIRDGNGRAVVEGVGDLAGGLNSIAAATAGLAQGTRFSGAAARFSSIAGSRVLGGLGGAISLGFGLYDVFTAESGYDKAAGGLAAASGAVAIGSVFFGPPGWVVGGLISGALGIASIFVGGGDDNETASLDDRLR